MQALFLCLAHKLMLLMESELKSKQQMINHKEIRRAKQISHQAEESARRKSRQFSLLYLNPFRRSHLSLKFIRWLRASSGYELYNATCYRIIEDGLRKLLSDSPWTSFHTTQLHTTIIEQSFHAKEKIFASDEFPSKHATDACRYSISWLQ